MEYLEYRWFVYDTRTETIVKRNLRKSEAIAWAAQDPHWAWAEENLG